MTAVNFGRLGIVPQGAYDANTVYQKLDIVTFDDGGGIKPYLYTHAAPGSGVAPTTTTHWLLLVDVESGVTSAAVMAALDGATPAAETIASDDEVLFKDTDDGGIVKKATAQEIANLASAGGANLPKAHHFIDTADYTHTNNTPTIVSNAFIITPASATSELLVTWSVDNYMYNATDLSMTLQLAYYRGSDSTYYNIGNVCRFRASNINSPGTNAGGGGNSLLAKLGSGADFKNSTGNWELRLRATVYAGYGQVLDQVATGFELEVSA